MRIMEPGHMYLLDVLDGKPDAAIMLVFVKRIGEKFPGNDGPGYPGTITQEVLRALIDRTKYVNGQREHPANYHVLRDLRSALAELEMRAADERGDTAAKYQIAAMAEPELAATCAGCGHVLCLRPECQR